MGTSINHLLPYRERLHNAAVANGNGTSLRLNAKYAAATLQISGTFTATVNFEATVDDINWIAIRGFNKNTGTGATTATAAGIFEFAVANMENFRARISDRSAGSVTVYGTATAASISSNSATSTTAATVAFDQTTPGTTNGVVINAGSSLIGKVDTWEAITASPVVGVKTVTTTAAALFAGASVKANRRKMLIRNESLVLRFRVGPSSVTQQTGFPIEPGALIEIKFDPTVALVVYAISEGSSLQVAVMES